MSCHTEEHRRKIGRSNAETRRAQIEERGRCTAVTNKGTRCPLPVAFGRRFESGLCATHLHWKRRREMDNTSDVELVYRLVARMKRGLPDGGLWWELRDRFPEANGKRALVEAALDGVASVCGSIDIEYLERAGLYRPACRRGGTS